MATILTAILLSTTTTMVYAAHQANHDATGEGNAGAIHSQQDAIDALEALVDDIINGVISVGSVDWSNILNMPAGFSDGVDDVDDNDSDPTNELQTWSTLPGIPAGFSDGVDDVDDADNDATNELQTLSRSLYTGASGYLLQQTLFCGSGEVPILITTGIPPNQQLLIPSVGFSSYTCPGFNGVDSAAPTVPCSLTCLGLSP